MLPFCILLFYCGYSKAQTIAHSSAETVSNKNQRRVQAFNAKDSTWKDLQRARLFSLTGTKYFNSQKAFELYRVYAEKGNAEAMNGLGNLYASGVGVDKDEHQAFKYFKKSAKNGYPEAWYNLALIFKDGIGKNQDFYQAFSYYKRGASLGSGKCMYGQGYLLYKGLGCTQSYERAFALFKQSASQRTAASYYMLGLCYRNGYGTSVNIDSAKFWLKKAQYSRDARVLTELESTTPENNNTITNSLNAVVSNETGTQRVDLKTGFKRVNQNVKLTDISGEYEGFLVKYDWSGKHMISQTELTLTLEQKQKKITGDWNEDGVMKMSLQGTIEDSSIVFNKTTYLQFDHYHKKRPLEINLQKALLDISLNNDTVYLSGNLNFYSPQSKEPEKPQFITLVRKMPATERVVLPKNIEVDSVELTHVSVYPNPTTGPITVSYTLSKKSTRMITITDALNGKTVYRSSPKQLKKALKMLAGSMHTYHEA